LFRVKAEASASSEVYLLNSKVGNIGNVTEMDEGPTRAPNTFKRRDIRLDSQTPMEPTGGGLTSAVVEGSE